MNYTQTVTVDFNADIGESFGLYTMGDDKAILRFVTSANIATGFHAGDPQWMAQVTQWAESMDVGIGAHPSYPDLQGFGRRAMALTPSEISNCVKYQIGALSAFVKDKQLQHVKPHGALYNRAAKDREAAYAIVSAIREFDCNLIHVVPSGSAWEDIARKEGVRFARECFTDRALMPDGSLAPRSLPNAVIHQPTEVIQRTIGIVTQGKTTAIDGSVIELQADTICLHGDTKSSIELARLVRSELEKNGVNVCPMAKFL